MKVANRQPARHLSSASPLERYLQAYSSLALAADGPPDYARYSGMKAAFVARFPEATPAQYARAMKIHARICRI